jgi:hypothetical protein
MRVEDENAYQILAGKREKISFTRVGSSLKNNIKVGFKEMASVWI